MLRAPVKAVWNPVWKAYPPPPAHLLNKKKANAGALFSLFLEKICG